MAQLETFVLNMRFFIGLVVFLVIVAVVTIAVWTGVKIWIFRARQRRAQRGSTEDEPGPDGRPVPPLGEGICDECQRVFDAVYYLPSGRRVCPECYKSAEKA